MTSSPGRSMRLAPWLVNVHSRPHASVGANLLSVGHLHVVELRERLRNERGRAEHGAGGRQDEPRAAAPAAAGAGPAPRGGAHRARRAST